MHQDGKRMPYWKLGTAGACFKRRFQVVISERQASAASVTASRRRQGAIYNASVPCSTRLLIRVSSSVSPIPVSYTHLRAHETGRNLVCRLLLEKKKKKKIIK